MSHTCHARGCVTDVRPTLLMCIRHWRLVPTELQRAVYTHYRDGQCDDKQPSQAWHLAAAAAIGYVALHERKPITMNEMKALVRRGYEKDVVRVYVEKLGVEKRAAIMRVIEEART
jgi:hypothetical protein